MKLCSTKEEKRPNFIPPAKISLIGPSSVVLLGRSFQSRSFLESQVALDFEENKLYNPVRLKEGNEDGWRAWVAIILSDIAMRKRQCTEIAACGQL